MKILVNNNEIDYIDSKNFPFVLSKENFLNQLDARRGEFSYTVELPNTIQNRKVLKIYNSKDVNYKYYTTEKFYYVVSKKDSQISAGELKINSVNRKTIQVNFISNSINWVNLIGAKKLRDIQSFADYPFIGMQTIFDNWDAQLADPDTHMNFFDVCFPLIAYGNYYLHYNFNANKYIDSTDYSSMFASPLFPSWVSSRGGSDVAGPLVIGTNAQVPHLEFADIPPSYYLVNIIRKIFEDIGFLLAGKWIAKPEIQKLILPTTGLKDVFYNWKTLGYYEITKNISATPVLVDAFDVQTFTEVVDGVLPFPMDEYTIGYLGVTSPIARIVGVTVDDRGWLGTNPAIYGDIFIPEDGEYQIDWSIQGQLSTIVDIAIPPATGPYTVFPIVGLFPIETLDQLDLIENATQTQVTPDSTYILNPYASKVLYKNGSITDTWNTIYWTPGAQTAYNYSESQSFRTNLKKGQILRFLFIYKDAFMPNVNQEIISFNLSVENLSGDTDFKIAKNLPDISQIDLIRSVVSMYNLQITPDPNSNTLYLEEFQDFFLIDKINNDITEISTYESENKNDIADKYNFEYQLDRSDFLINLDPSLNNFVRETVNPNNSEQLISCKFSDTRMQEFQIVRNIAKDVGGFTFDNLSNPRFVSAVTVELPMIADQAHYNSPQFGEDYETWNYNYNTRILIMDGSLDFGNFPIPLRILNGTSDDLEFRSEFPRAQFDQSWEQLYERNYYDWILNLELGDEQSVLVNLNEYYYNKLQPQIYIKISNVLYYLKKIENFNPARKQLTRLVLVKKVNV